MTSDSEATIRLAQAGDRDAFAQLVNNQYASMFRFACKYCGNRQDAEDVTQQACIKLARAIGQYRFEAAFSTWLYRLVINCARDWYKSAARRHSDPDSHQRLQELATENGAEATVMLHQVMQQVSDMGEGFREALVLVLGEGLSHAEAAAILEVKESTVSWRLHEIRKRLNAEQQPGSGQ